MVRLHSLLAVTLATGSALASSNEYQRRSEVDVQSRDFEQGAGPRFHFRCGLACAHPQPRGLEDEEDLSLRDLDVVDLEARTPPRIGIKSAGKALEFGRRLSKSHGKHADRFVEGLSYGQQVYDSVNSRGLEDDEDLFVRDLDVVDDLEVRTPPRVGIKSAGKALEFGRRLSKSHGKHADRFVEGLSYGQQVYDTVNSRGLEDDEDLFVRDLDVVDLEARTPPRVGFKSAGKALEFGRRLSKSHGKHADRFVEGLSYGQQVYDTVNSRGLEDDEDLFVRDLDVVVDLEARTPPRVGFKSAGKALEFGRRLSKSHGKHADSFVEGLSYGQQLHDTLNSRGLEDDEDLFVRDLDAEELFGREYDFLVERDTIIIDDLD